MEEQAAPGMITILADHDIEKYARVLLGVVHSEGWQELAALRVVSFSDVGLPHDSADRVVWRLAQASNMLMLTANRNMKGADSLERTLTEENHAAALPVLTIGRVNRMGDPTYRLRCAARLIEISSRLDMYRGVGRLFIP
jgi:hypothetical protein